MEQINNQNEFIATSGIKVVMNGDPSEEACENFIKIALELYNKYLKEEEHKN